MAARYPLGATRPGKSARIPSRCAAAAQRCNVVKNVSKLSPSCGAVLGDPAKTNRWSSMRRRVTGCVSGRHRTTAGQCRRTTGPLLWPHSVATVPLNITRRRHESKRTARWAPDAADDRRARGGKADLAALGDEANRAGRRLAATLRRVRAVRETKASTDRPLRNAAMSHGKYLSAAAASSRKTRIIANRNGARLCCWRSTRTGSSRPRNCRRMAASSSLRAARLSRIGSNQNEGV